MEVSFVKILTDELWIKLRGMRLFMFEKLDRKFYKKDAIELSKALLGKYLIHHINGETMIGKIVETEAYMGFHDKGAHTYNGRRTPRTEVMYGEEGHAYVYFIYGMYHCLNVVAAEKEIAQAVLIRALEPIEGLNKMALYRFNKPLSELKKHKIFNLTNGPGKLCKAFNITKDMNGEDLTNNELYICENKDCKESFDIIAAKRIGIDYAEEAKDYLWRFYIKGNKYVSIL